MASMSPDFDNSSINSDDIFDSSACKFDAVTDVDTSVRTIKSARELETVRMATGLLGLSSRLLNRVRTMIRWRLLAGRAGFEPTSPAPKAGRISRLP